MLQVTGWWYFRSFSTECDLWHMCQEALQSNHRGALSECLCRGKSQTHECINHGKESRSCTFLLLSDPDLQSPARPYTSASATNVMMSGLLWCLPEYDQHALFSNQGAVWNFCPDHLCQTMLYSRGCGSTFLHWNVNLNTILHQHEALGTSATVQHDSGPELTPYLNISFLW